MMELEIIVHGDHAAEKDEAAPEPVELDLQQDRYARLRQIPWWNQDRLRNARILVVGAGAIGNEVIKLLSLLGVGQVFILDLDRIEDTNLTRSVLFRAADIGRPKAEVSARRAMELNPDVRAFWLTGNILTDVGLGLFRHMDLVIGALDNREARLAVNRACWKVGRPWVDGAIEVLSGVARLFSPPDGPCYECTLSHLDYKLLSARKSCALLRRQDTQEGKVPTTPTTASVIAGIQVQEALKLLHRRPEMPVLAGKGFFFNGATHDSYTIQYDRREDCLSHVTYEPILSVPCGNQATFRTLLDAARSQLGPKAVLRFDRELVVALSCTMCGRETPFYRLLDCITPDQAACPHCGEERSPLAAGRYSGAEPWGDCSLAEVGFPLWEIIPVSDGDRWVYLELAADRESVYRQWGGNGG